MIRTSLPILFALSVLLLYGCRDEPAQRNATDTTAGVYDLTFPQPRFSDGRTLDTVMNVDLDDDGRLEYIVTSIHRDDFVPPTARADMIELYRFDTVTKEYRAVSVDSLMWITDLELRDVTDDRLPDLVVRTNSGGNDPTASIGMYIYSGDGGRIRTIFHADDGDPELATLEGIRGDAILRHSELWPDFAPHAAAVPYVDDILAYKGNAYTSVRGEHGGYFMREANRYLSDYQTARTMQQPPRTDSLELDSLTETYQMGLFTPAALTILSFHSAGNGQALRSFWDSEHSYLQSRLAPSQFAALDSMYASAVLQ